MEKKRCIAVVLAAGAGKRMNSKVAKQYLLLKDKPVIYYALHAFEDAPLIDDIILVVGKGEISFCQEEIVNKFDFKKVKSVIEGGEERYFSVWKALEHIKSNQEEASEEYVFIHDGARPFLSEEIINDTYEAALLHGACVAGMPVKDTIKIADEDEFAKETPKRSSVWAVQTPQVFDFSLIYLAYDKLMEQLEELTEAGTQITDDAMVVETMLKKPVKLVKASYLNMKITTPEDIAIAESLM